jgi:hypothetical protein
MREIVAYALIWCGTLGILAAVLGLPSDYTKPQRLRVVRRFRLSEPLVLVALELLPAGIVWTIVLS